MTFNTPHKTSNEVLEAKPEKKHFSFYCSFDIKPCYTLKMLLSQCFLARIQKQGAGLLLLLPWCNIGGAAMEIDADSHSTPTFPLLLFIFFFKRNSIKVVKKYFASFWVFWQPHFTHFSTFILCYWCSFIFFNTILKSKSLRMFDGRLVFIQRFTTPSHVRKIIWFFFNKFNL